ncbi:MAG TPA: BON domain-containing protein [Planctomycetaceae bacterium]|jgi:osmotically-inducible protein OsmY|nr:BON domain-containing protein [Planctomycetaceae bacterium]
MQQIANLAAGHATESNRTLETGRRLHADVRHALVHNSYFAAHHLAIELRENEVVLSGELGSYFHKQMAQESVLSVHGVRRVHNEIRVVNA